VSIKNNYCRIKALRNVLKQQKPDVALAMMSTSSILLALASKGLNIPVLGSERIHPPMWPLGRIWEWLRRISYGQLDAVITLAVESASWLKKRTNVKKVVIIPNAIAYPIAAQEPKVSPKTSNDHCLSLIAVGRLAPQKGFDRLLRAFAELAPRFPDWHLTILGEGDSRDVLEDLQLKLNLEDRVSLPGVVGNLGEWYESADLFVMTSLFEGFPNTLTEAMAYGLPVVSVDCDTGPRDIIQHQIDGLLVSQDNHDALAEALATLMGDKILRDQYAIRAIEIRERLSIERVAGMWEKVFIEISKKDEL
jgi:glycosyltransferase involved in cell wall biosynthesis